MNIPHIKLLRGSHDDTGETGQGCFMNVVAYLNGEEVITDRSECVCPIIREVAIYLNDVLYMEDRQRMLPFVLRAMGSRTEDETEIARRMGFFSVLVAEQINIFNCFDQTYALGELRRLYNKLRFLGDLTNNSVIVSIVVQHCDDLNCSDLSDEVRAASHESFFRFLDAALPPLVEPQAEAIDRALELHKIGQKIPA